MVSISMVFQENTWEPRDNLSCEALILDFERRTRESNNLLTVDPVKAIAEHKRTFGVGKKHFPVNTGESPYRIGFDRGLRPVKIIGATDCGGELCFLMKWKGKLSILVVKPYEYYKNVWLHYVIHNLKITILYSMMQAQMLLTWLLLEKLIKDVLRS